MRAIRWFGLASLAAVVAACGGKDEAQVDEALSRDLSLAANAQPYGQQFVSPMEMGQYPQGYQQYPQQYAPYPQGYYPQQPAPAQVVYRAPATPRASSGTIYRAPAPAPQPTVRRNTKRDALIGATAGAIAGAAIGRDVKGAAIGAAAGGILGAVVGHTIDVERTP
jgi:hypothetical protein